MQRRRFLSGVLAVAGSVSITGCLGGDTGEPDELLGRGILRIENITEDAVTARYGLLSPDEDIEDADLSSVEMGVSGDSFEQIYPNVSGGPHRFVVVVEDKEGSPGSVEWDIDECEEKTITARIFPDVLNISSTRCVGR